MDTSYQLLAIGFFIGGMFALSFGFPLRNRIREWLQIRLHSSDNGSLDWPEVEKPKNTEYRLTEDGELDGDFPVEEPINAVHVDMGDLRLTFQEMDYDKSKVDEYAGAQSSAWVLTEPFRDGMRTFSSARNAFPMTGFPTGMSVQEAFRRAGAYPATDPRSQPPEPPPQEPGYTTLTR